MRHAYGPRLKPDHYKTANGTRIHVESELAIRSNQGLPSRNNPTLHVMTGREPERLQALIEFMEDAMEQGMVEEACRARAGRTIENLRRQYNECGL